MRRISTAFLVFSAALVFTASNARAQWKTPWSYQPGAADGPAHWAKLDPAYAACDGKAQSPIDIRSATKASLPALRFEYKSGPVTIINNGYTAVRINYPAGNGNFLVIGDKRYELTQFHFHHPSEEKLNGKSFDMVIHFMHQSSYGHVVGVAVFVSAGNPGAAFANVVGKLWENMPLKAGPEHKIAGLSLNPAGLLPRDTAYYMYAGSQTAPPCTEGVTWIVLKTPVQIAPDKIAAFAKLYPHDVRPVQRLNGRSVKKSE